MESYEKLKEFSKREEKLAKSIKTEETTKTSMVMPFFSLLDYDVFNSDKFIRVKIIKN